MKGKIVKGHQVGRTIGFPTANLSVEDSRKILPGNGVYAVWAVLSGKRYKGMLSIGNRPTLDDGNSQSIEVYLLDFSGDLYGAEMEVSFVYQLRANRKFPSLADLKAQLETDRRHIRSRIRSLEEKLGRTEKRRSLQTQRRQKDGVRTVALVGYTNTGKSTLLNALTGADVFVKDALFATLDPTSRRLEIQGMQFLLVDTVGFLQDLPHHLIEAFRSTLESALHCDLALIVCDASADYETQFRTTMDTLNDLGFAAPYLLVMNKCDKAAAAGQTAALPHDAVCISAKTGMGLDRLKADIFSRLRDRFVCVELFVPYARSAQYAAIRSLLSEREIEYTEEGMKVQAVIPIEHAEKFRSFSQTAR